MTAPRHQPSPPPARPRPALAALLLAASDVYTASICLYLVLRLLAGDRLWPVALVGVFLHWLLLPGFVVLAVMLAKQRWRRAALAVLPVLAFLWLFGGLFLPAARPAPACGSLADGCRTLVVMAYNTGSGLADPAELAEAIRASDADIVGLVEVVDEQAEVLDRELADRYPTRLFYPAVVNGKALLSRYPLVEAGQPFQLNTSMTHFQATLDVDGQPLRVIVAHPPRPFFSRQQGFFYIPGTDRDYADLARLATGGPPAIMLGDFNNTDQSHNYALLTRAGLADAFREAGWGFGTTFPAPRRYGGLRFWPLVRIDYVWTTGHFDARRAWVGPDAGSDHLPVLAELAWHTTREAGR